MTERPSTECGHRFVMVPPPPGPIYCRICGSALSMEEGVYRADDNYAHVMPTLGSHVASYGCWCQPYPDIREPRVIIHRDNQHD